MEKKRAEATSAASRVTELETKLDDVEAEKARLAEEHAGELSLELDKYPH